MALCFREIVDAVSPRTSSNALVMYDGGSFSYTAGIVSIGAPALQGLRLLLHDLQSIRDAPETIGNLKDDIWAIELALASLQAISEQKWESLGTTVADEVKATIATCTKACEIFRSDLQRWTGRSRDGRLSRLDRAKVWIFKQAC